MAKPDLTDYVDVAERIKQFYEDYPDGSLQCDMLSIQELPDSGGDPKPHVVYRAAAYRKPDDPRPGHGVAQERLPGLTPYTKGSELMNAETSAWGRALAALGYVSKKVASADEVRNRQVTKPAQNKKNSAAPRSDVPNDFPNQGKEPDGDFDPVTASFVEKVKETLDAVELVTEDDAKTILETFKQKDLNLERQRGALAYVGKDVKDVKSQKAVEGLVHLLTTEEAAHLHAALDKLTKKDKS